MACTRTASPGKVSLRVGDGGKGRNWKRAILDAKVMWKTTFINRCLAKAQPGPLPCTRRVFCLTSGYFDDNPTTLGSLNGDIPLA